MIEGAEYSTDSLDPREVKLAKVLIRNNKMTVAQLNDFLKERNRFEEDGKRYLGDILVDRKYIEQDVLDQFFKENNDMYHTFCERLVFEGFLTQEQFEAIKSHEEASTNLVSALSKLGIMTRDSFSKLFSKRVNALRLGDWLLTKKKIKEENLKSALDEQNVYRLHDYLLFYKIVNKELMDKVREKFSI